MKEYCGNFFILNGKKEPVISFDNNMVYKGETIYEVIRLVNGVPVFFSDHFERLRNSVARKERAMLADESIIRKSIELLVSAEKKKENNIKIVFNYRENSGNFMVYYIESVYPTEEQYRKGVRGILFYASRSDPQSKVLDFRLRSEIHQELLENGAYEALLVNEDDLVTEGSKSNVFFLKEGKLFTAPDEMILKGVTRKHLLEICSANSIEVVFRCVGADELRNYKSVFITGTSPMILPFRSLEDLSFDVRDELFEKLRKLYLERVEESLREYTGTR